MATGLKKKWFLTLPDSSGYVPPGSRHTGSVVGTSTDNNSAKILLEGDAYLKAWYGEIDDLKKQPAGAALYHSGQRIDNVVTLGHSKQSTTPSSGALDLLQQAHGQKVQVYVLASGAPVSTPPGDVHPDVKTSLESVALLQKKGITAAIDNRYLTSGSVHQEFTCFRGKQPTVLMGSAGIHIYSWDTSSHKPSDPDRHPKAQMVGPRHDVGLRIQGPAFTDLEQTFLERWNDSKSRTTGLLGKDGKGKPPAPITNAAWKPSSTVPGRTLSIQVLHTYGKAPGSGKNEAYSWSDKGEWTIWRSLLNAIDQAGKYIYIEDPFFMPMGKPGELPGSSAYWKQVDPIYHLAMAIGRGVKVVICTTGRSAKNQSTGTGRNVAMCRDLGIQFLRDAAKSSKNGGEVVVVSPRTGVGANSTWIEVHSKVVICDDEFVLLGTASITQRGLTSDSEVAVGIVDQDNKFAKSLRSALWAGHLGLTSSSKAEVFKDTYATLKSATTTKPQGHIVPYGATDSIPVGQKKTYVPAGADVDELDITSYPSVKVAGSKSGGSKVSAGSPNPNPAYKVIRIAWTIDDGPIYKDNATALAEKALGGIPATWYICCDRLGKKGAQRDQRVKELVAKQKQGHEIAIHSSHPAPRNHVFYFPTKRGYYTEKNKTGSLRMAKAMSDLANFKAELEKAGLIIRFIRVPGGLVSEIEEYVKQCGVPGAKSGKLARTIIYGGSPSTSELSQWPKLKNVVVDYNVFKSTLKKLGLRLWGGSKSGKPVIGAISWEKESYHKKGAPNDTALPAVLKLIKGLNGGTLTRAYSCVILTHDRDPSDAKKTKDDIAAMEAAAKIPSGKTQGGKKATGVKIEYYTMSGLWKVLRPGNNL